VRYQKGRRDDWIAAAVIALHWNRANAGAWDELIELASAAPHIPTMLDLFGRVPPAARPHVVCGQAVHPGQAVGAGLAVRERVSQRCPERGVGLEADIGPSQPEGFTVIVQEHTCSRHRSRVPERTP
jgi:hypothetical protein